MAHSASTNSELKEKSNWQLFTNDGKFDSKLPPSQRLHRQKGYKLLVVHMPKSAKSKPGKPQPQVEYIENFVIVWLDQSTGKRKDNQATKSQLKQIGNAVKIFTDATECSAFISTIKDEKVLVILSGTVEENFVSKIHDKQQLESIYVFSPDTVKNETWFNQYPEIRGVYTTIVSLCDKLGKDVKTIDHNLLGFEIMEQSSKESQQEALFMYDQLFRDIVFAVSDENMQDMYEYCQKEYRDNEQEQKFLRALKQGYPSHSPIWWYTQESFLYRMLNKALRTHQYDILYLMRVFIRQLHEQIVAQQTEENIGQRTLFRGQGMEKVDFERLRANEGGLLSISSFLSTSTNREIGLKFARQALEDKRKVSILMEIKAENNTKVPVANISDLSIYKAEQEWLFSIGSVFRIGSLKCPSEGIWIVPLTLTDDQDKQLNALKEHFQKSMTDSNTCLSFANLMHQLASWKKSEYFYLMALQTETAWQRRSLLFNNLGMVEGELENYDEALKYYHKSISLKGKDGSTTEADKATAYNNIATLYYKQNKMSEAIKYFQKAIDVSNAEDDKNESLTATLNANLATILNEQGKHKEALEKCQQALDIRTKTLPPLHPDIASSYGSMASTMNHMGLHEEAVEYAQKALDIDRQALPPDHPQTLLHMNHLQIFKQTQQQQQQQQPT